MEKGISTGSLIEEDGVKDSLNDNTLINVKYKKKREEEMKDVSDKLSAYCHRKSPLITTPLKIILVSFAVREL